MKSDFLVPADHAALRRATDVRFPDGDVLLPRGRPAARNGSILRGYAALLWPPPDELSDG